MKYLDYNEKKLHGSYDFPIQYYHITSSHLEYIMPLHWHRDFEIVRVLSGSFTLYLDNVKYELSSGDFALVQCGTMHRGEPKDCIYECVVFDLNMLRRKGDINNTYLLPIVERTICVNGSFHDNNRTLSTTVESLFNTMHNQLPYYQMTVYSLLYSLFTAIYTDGNVISEFPGKRAGHQAKAIIGLLDWIEIHYAEQITLKQLARISGMNQNYLCRIFREYTGRTPIDYINNLRISAARHELLISSSSVTDIAYECGFNDLSYFSRIFKKYTGQTPRSYNKNTDNESEQNAVN